MKKLLAILIIMALGLSLAACSEKDNDENGEQPAAPGTPADTEVPESDPGEANYVIINIRDFGEITVRLYPEYAPNTVARFVENVRSGFYTGRNIHRIMPNFMFQGGSFDGQGGGDPTVEGIFTEVHPDARHYYGALCLAANQMGMGSDSFYIVNNKNPNTFEEIEITVLTNFQMEIMYIREILDDAAENEDEYVEEIGREMFDDAVIYWEAMLEHALEQLEAFENTPEEVRARYAEVGGTPQLDGNYTVFGYTVDGFDVIDAISAVPVVPNMFNENSMPTQEIIIEWIITKTTLD